MVETSDDELHDELDELREGMEPSDRGDDCIRWEQAVWLCPVCNSPGLDPIGVPHKPAGWEFNDRIDAEDVADPPRLYCTKCESVIDVELNPQDEDD